MKRKAILFFMISILSFSEDLTLDTMLNNISTNSYEKNIYNIDTKKNKVNQKFYTLDNYNGITGSSKNTYLREDRTYKTSGTISYGDFYINGSKEENEESELILGINKNIKDMIYSENDKNLNNNNLDKKINKLEYLKNIETKKLNLVDLYRDYKNIEFEIIAKTNGVKTLENEEEILKKSFKLGKSPKIDLKSATINRLNLEIELKYLKKNKAKIEERFLYDFKINVAGNTLMNIPKKTDVLDKFLNNIGNKDLDILKIQKNKIKENINYLKYDNKYPDISIGLEHDFGSKEESIKENRIFLEISKDLFYYDNDLENEKYNYQRKMLTISEETDKRNSEILKTKEEYDNLLMEYQVNKNKANLEKNKYDIKKLEYKLGKVTYLDLIDNFNDYLTYKINAEKSKNNLNAYIYKIIIRGDI
ncbi:TolC family protein [Fusobacterium sp. IOR10]|uniref:TolC family protein n=1 Tax=Fusobacterium sp. IOR10 TaxID=2665157 RepID=UPI0013D6AE05|nr:TolC family protein [Fusobacterium sp. IOR10]